MRVAFHAMKAQLDVPPLTLSLSPEYEGEGTRSGAPNYLTRALGTGEAPMSRRGQIQFRAIANFPGTSLTGGGK